MRRYFIDFASGLMFGFVLYFGNYFFSILIYDQGGLIGFETLSKFFGWPASFFLFAGGYLFLGVIFFLFYGRIRGYFNATHSARRILSALALFLVGILFALLLFLLFVSLAFSLMEGPF